LVAVFQAGADRFERGQFPEPAELPQRVTTQMRLLVAQNTEEDVGRQKGSVVTGQGVERQFPDTHFPVAERLRHERWKKIAQNASQQSQRSALPIIEPIKNVEEVCCAAGDFDLKLIPTLTGERKNLKEIFDSARPRNILVFIGPEGDFTDEEIRLALESGCVLVSLGDTTLRVDTAAIAVSAFLKLYADG
jgi:hypothetical protein